MNRIEEITEYISKVFQVNTNFTEKGKRYPRKMYPKKVLMHVLYYKEEIKLKEVGRMLGYSDHVVVIHHLRSFDALYDTDEKFREMSNLVFAKHYELIKNENINKALQLPAQEDTLCVLADSDLPND